MLCSKNHLKGEHSPDSYVHVRRPWEGSSMASEGWSCAVGRVEGRAQTRPQQELALTEAHTVTAMYREAAHQGEVCRDGLFI